MTLSTNFSPVQYNGDGSTSSFSVTFTFWDADDLRVIHTDAAGTDTVWTRGTQYTVTGGSGSAGTVEASTSPTDYTPASGEKLTIKSNVPLSQADSFPLGGAFPSTTVEQRLDKTVRQIQQQTEELDRSLKLEETSTYTDLTVPDPVSQNVLRWKADLSGFENVATSTALNVTTELADTDSDTKIQVEETADEDIIRFDVAGSQKARWDATGLVLGADVAGDGVFHIGAGLAGAVTASVNANEAIIESDQTNMGLTFLGGTSSVQRIYFGDTDSATKASLVYLHALDQMTLNGPVSDEIQIRNGIVFINGGDANVDLVVRGNASENIIYADASVGNAGMGTNTPNASALLDLVSTTKGLGAPAMTSTQRDNISTPREGLIVANTTDNSLDYYTGSSWIRATGVWTNSGSIDLTSGSPTAVSLLSGASNVNEIECHVSAWSSNAANQSPMVQIGDSGGLETTGYTGLAANISSTVVSTVMSTGFLVSEETQVDAGKAIYFEFTLKHMGSNVWTFNSNGQEGTQIFQGSGFKALSGTLDRVTITTSGGTATFDGGTAYLRWR